MRIAGKDYTRAEVIDLVGDVSQIAQITSVTRTDGMARGMRSLLVRSAGGLSFEVLVDRALDIGWAEVSGMPIAWRSRRGDTAPAFAEPAGTGWTRTFGGGLLTTCGLASTGAPSRDAGEELGLHGRISHVPAEQVSTELEWVGDELHLRITGRAVESRLGGPSLELRRTIATTVGRPHVTVNDVVTNVGAVPAPHMHRHHINLGFPLVRPGDAVDGELALAGARADATSSADDWNIVAPPGAGAREEVWYARPTRTGRATVGIRRGGRQGPTVARVSWDTTHMPWLVLWKDQLIRTNVIALEPSTSRDEGRASAREQGDLLELGTDESVTYSTTIDIPGAAA